MSFALRTARAMRPVTRQVQVASFSKAARMMAEGDAFNKREEASEAIYIKQQERQKLEQLKAKIAKQEEQLAKDKAEAEKMGKSGQ